MAKVANTAKLIIVQSLRKKLEEKILEENQITSIRIQHPK